MQQPTRITVDGNEAVARIAYRLSDVCAIYPITPASPMGEWADSWAAGDRPNLWGTVPRIVEMQSEGGAAGAIHGALQAGALACTFTASQGLLLMIPNMYKIAGELTPTVFHVASRSLAVQALSIFGDHSDVMATRATGFAMLAAASVQEAQDLAAIAHLATLEGRIPVLHFFDGFRTSHEVSKIVALEEDTLRGLVDAGAVHAHRARALSPEHPVLRGSSQNPDVYFQGRERVNPFYERFPSIMQAVMDRFAEATGRHYHLFDYHGDPAAERVLILMGSGAEAASEVVDYLNRQGARVGVLRVHLYRPFDSAALLQALPAGTRRIAVLDRTKEPGADGEPLYKDVISALARDACSNQARFRQLPLVVGGRYGLSSKEFTPGMIRSVFDELQREQPRNGFTVGIHDDLSATSLEWDPDFRTDAGEHGMQAVFYGLGSDGTVSANKNSIKIIGTDTDLHAQGYFVYDSKKSGAVTVSHLRFGERPIRSSYLIGDGDARFVACHQAVFLERYDMLAKAAEGAVFLLNSPEPPERVWDSLPREMQQQMIDKQIQFYCIDAYRVAREANMGQRINTIMQTCFFAISGVLPREQAIASIKRAVEQTYGRRGRRIVEFNFRAIDAALENLHRIPLPQQADSGKTRPPVVPEDAPDFVRRFTAELIAGRGDEVPVSLMPADGTFPLGTAAWEKRKLALEIPVWETDLCTHCGKCPLVCPHGVIRSKLFPASLLNDAPPAFRSVPVKGKDYPRDHHIAYQVAPDDCTGCGLCVDICPIRDKSNASRKALNMAPAEGLRETERANWEFFLGLPEYDRSIVKRSTIKGAMLLQPLFEFSGACVGCGETPYIKLATQLFGDRMLVANATGCSSIYGGNLPTTPWAANREGRGPAWNNSLFEDNAEFGLGMRIAVDRQAAYARELLQALRSDLDSELVEQLLQAEQSDEAGIRAQRDRVRQLRERLGGIDRFEARELESVADNLIRRSVWIIGGDGWAYDIGYGGLDHVLASGEDVNILVLDTEVYSNTGGQTSKATPRGAVAKFSAGGKPNAKKDLARLAMDYENVYVAHVAYAARDVQALRAFLEAEAHPGPSLIIAYSPCIAHGVDLSHNHRQQQLAVRSGHWPLFRHDPARAAGDRNPLHLDSPPPDIPYRTFVETETRFRMLWQSHPQAAEAFLKQSQQEVRERYCHYQQLAELPVCHLPAGDDADDHKEKPS
ncbi:MAG TPA: pyruvate:ferredoxin (flavodoxin) oxidoreductase [Gammaproteobacteria bacterium]|nr:pyruvate:ferredoxin (flavodoxin) oxidoreductase [Gammaproteobacteria bacterium]